ncbi:MAG: aspartyl protease family protein [Acidobacteria bacterium]|nr:aspartyl protease family protein [Acidobacteriota bacterium]
MPRRLLKRFLFAAVCAAAMPLATGAHAPQDGSADVQVQLADLLFAEGRFAEAADAYERAVKTTDSGLASRAGAGLVLSRLRVGDFQMASTEAAEFRRLRPDDPMTAAIHGEALWASGLFQESESAYDAALKTNPNLARARHGRARSLAARSRLAEAMVDAQEALRLSPREGEFHYTVGSIYERMHHFEDAAAAFGNYVNLLPNRDRSEKAAWARAEIRFLDSFKGRTPLDLGPVNPDRTWTVPIRIDHEKVIVRARVNGGSPEDFVLDTGAEQTVISRDVARKRGVAPVTYMQSAGVGDVGMRGLQVGRLDSLEVGDLKVRNVPVLIKNPPLGGLPAREPESFSPLALGLSMRLDYERRQLIMISRGREPGPSYEIELPLRMHRLAMVRGMVNGTHPTTFVVDTGGEVISISDTTAGLIQPANPYRRIPLRVYGPEQVSPDDRSRSQCGGFELKRTDPTRPARVPCGP